MKSRIFLIDDIGEYIDKQLMAFTILYDTTASTSATIVHYNLNNIPDALNIGSLNKKFDFKTYSEYFELSFDELDDELIDYYKYMKNDPELNNDPYIILIDGCNLIKPTPYGEYNEEDFKDYLAEKYTLLEYLNMYIICIL